MIEWLAFGAMALVGSMFGSDDKRSSSGGSSSTPFDPDCWRREQAAKERDWRNKWEPEVDRTRWIPQSAAHRIIEAYPPPGAERDTFGATTRVAIRKLLAEFATHNQQHLIDQKAKVKTFFDTV